MGGVCEDGWWAAVFHTSTLCLHRKYMGKSFNSTHTHTHTNTNALMCFLGTYGSLNLTFEDFFFFFFAFSKEIVI